MSVEEEVFRIAVKDETAAPLRNMQQGFSKGLEAAKKTEAQLQRMDRQETRLRVSLVDRTAAALRSITGRLSSLARTAITIPGACRLGRRRRGGLGSLGSRIGRGRTGASYRRRGSRFGRRRRGGPGDGHEAGG
jgi:hypothetical protein